MVKSVPNFKSYTVGAIGTGATVIAIDQAGADLLKARLAAGDWTYASIEQGDTYEVVKITSVALNLIAVVRGIDGTPASSFLTGALIKHIIAQATITDVVQEEELNGILLTGTGAAVVTKLAANSYNIHVEPMNLISGDDDIEVTSAHPNYVISIKH